jgi:lysophospholipase L1-like esterase
VTRLPPALAARLLEIGALLCLALSGWALLGEGLSLRIAGTKILSVTGFLRPLVVFWGFLGARIALAVRTRPRRPHGLRSTGPRWGTRLAAPGLVLLALLTLGEAAASLLRSETRTAGENLLSHRPPDGGPLGARRHATIQGVEIRTNSLGFRDTEFSVTKPADEFRILGVGDSFTFGNGVAGDDTWPQQLERLLAQETNRKIQVINGGIWGLDTVQEVDYAEGWIERFAPDLVVLAHVPNDAVTIYQMEPVDRNLYHNSHLYRFLRERFWHVRYVVQTEKRFDFSDENPGWKLSREALARLRDFTRKRDLPLLVVQFPYMRAWTDKDRRDLEIVGAVLDRLEIPRLDLGPVFFPHDPLELQSRPRDLHPNRRGYAIASRAIADRIFERGLLSGATTPD